MKPRYLFVTIFMIAALALSACSSAAAPSAGSAAPASNSAATSSSTSAPASAPKTVSAQVPADSAAPRTTTAAPGLAGVSDLEQTVEQIYAQVNPSVVAIEVVEGASGTSSLPFFGNRNPGQPQLQIPQQALGSGFVWDKDGHIVTNNHVVSGASKVSVTFYDGTIVPATVVGTDPDSDLAVIKVDVPADQLQPVKLADSTQVKVGQLAVAIGNPFGNENTMTVGFVSALGRALPVDNGNANGVSYTIPDVIQTDAPINPGNSGGVLTDDQGQVVGVTAAIDSPVRASSGVGFVIPSAIVQKVVPELIKSGHYQHSWLGISGGTLIPDLATAMNLKSSQRGALINEVTAGSPAEKAGLQGGTRDTTINGQNARVGGDVIIAIENHPVKTFDDLVAYLASSTSVGQTVKLTVLRNGQQQDINVTLAARPTANAQQPQVTQQQPANPRGNTAGQPWLGIQGLTISSDIVGDLGLPSDQTGVLIEQVQPNSPAEQAGLQGGSKSVTISGQDVMTGGDVITAIDHQTVTGMSDLLSTLQQDNVGQKVTLTIVRNGKQMDVPVTLAARPANQ